MLISSAPKGHVEKSLTSPESRIVPGLLDKRKRLTVQHAPIFLVGAKTSAKTQQTWEALAEDKSYLLVFLTSVVVGAIFLANSSRQCVMSV